MNANTAIACTAVLLRLIGASTCLSGCAGSAQETMETIAVDGLRSRDRSGVALAMLVSNYACHDCFGVLDSAVIVLRGEGFVGEYWAVVRSERSAIERRSARYRGRRASPHADSVVLDVNPGPRRDPWPRTHCEGGLFGAFDVGRTPALLIVPRTGAARLVPFDELFGSEGVAAELAAEVNAQRLRVLIGSRLAAHEPE